MARQGINYEKANNELVLKFESEWRINAFLVMSAPVPTAVFSPLKDIDARLYFDVFYRISNSEGGTKDIAHLHVNLRNKTEVPIPKTLNFDLDVWVFYSNGKLYTRYISPGALDLAGLSSLTCIKMKTPLYFNASPRKSNQTSHLILKCRLLFHNYLPATPTYHGEVNSHLHLVNFAKNYKAIYQSKAFSDVSIQVGDKTVQCHKFVLAAHSPVFKSMLENETIITVSDTSCEVFEGFLNFLYCAEVADKSFNNVEKLYSLAKKYEVESLEQECVRILNEGGKRLTIAKC